MSVTVGVDSQHVHKSRDHEEVAEESNYGTDDGETVASTVTEHWENHTENHDDDGDGNESLSGGRSRARVRRRGGDGEEEVKIPDDQEKGHHNAE